jgi:hypothetical protein
VKEYIGGHSFQTDAEVQEAVSLSFCFKSPKFCAEGMFADKIL